MKNFFSVARCLFGATALLASCMVYAPIQPMQPTVSTIRQAGQVELTASIQPSLRLEAGAVVSPLPHVLLAAAGTYRPRLEDINSSFGTRQWEAGGGGYVSLGPGAQLTGLVGGGQGGSEQSEETPGFLFFAGSLTEYRARYHKFYGQLGISTAGSAVPGRSVLGLVYRYTWVGFDELTYAVTPRPGLLTVLPAAGMVPLTGMGRHELLAYYRANLDRAGYWQAQLAGGVSADAGHSAADPLAPGSGYVSNTVQQVLLFSSGLVYHFHRVMPTLPETPRP